MKSLFLLAGLTALLLSLAYCTSTEPTSTEAQLAEIHCGNCHATPTPDLLTKEIWISKVMPLMGAYLGVYEVHDRDFYLKDELERPYLETVFPADPAIPDSTWRALKNYFIEGAPNALPLPEEVPTVYAQNRFTIREITDPAVTPAPSLSTCVSAQTEEGFALATLFREGKSLVRNFDGRGRVTNTDTLSSAVSQLPSAFGDAHLMMGSLVPSDVPSGTLSGQSSREDSLRRPLAYATLDLNLDGVIDTAIAEYGNRLGALSLLTAGEKLTLSPTPGAIRLRVADLNQDGHDDLVALFAQGDERIEVYYAGDGFRRAKRLVRFPPSYGSSDLEIIDVDGDGDLDFIHTAGDNYDYRPIPKPYHGVRIFSNEAGAFTETYFYHLHGAYGVEAADFDQDGDVDLAAIAYFVPPLNRAIKGFVYLEQTKDLIFRASGFEKPVDQHFIVMDKGDVDGDGDLDLVIGNFAAYLPDGFPDLRRPADRKPAAIVLTNTLK
ncbi:VCBS repeat-containing protein [Lewinella sp. 4G2]|uniref:FG-GAP repeat domain-containing protein n=1 Tax=Lewinella sp. 4G2 TaxID=1803372 RepID=UPI0007B49D57|nr:VCBS repeat-containing protein [Lewinella sp. 4G2]OAV45323.1 hypothetical protein A3850_012835 [Lewinella sp. 4G2]